MTKNQNRYVHIDFLKSLAIILVILGHVLQGLVRECDSNILFKFIYSFHMPLFMFLSGYLSGYDFSNGFLRKKFAILLIPFFVWLLISGVFNFGLQMIHGEFYGFLRFLGHAIVSPDAGGLWFLWVLFFCYVLWFVTQRKGKSILGAALGMVGAYVMSFAFGRYMNGLNLVAWLFPFFVLGVFFKKSWELGMPQKRHYYIGTIALYFILMTIWKRGGIELNGYPELYAKILARPYQFLTASLAIYSFYGISRLWHYDASIIQWISRNTLGLYAVQFWVLSISVILVGTVESSISGILGIVSVFSLTTILSILAVIVINKTKLRVPLFGR